MKDDVYRDIEHAEVVDVNGLDIGKIEDFTFEKETKKLKHFVVKGNNPVILEWLGLQSSYGLLLPHEHIRRQKGKEVFISVAVKDLKTIQHIDDSEQRFTVMRNVDVIAEDGEDLGKIIDGIFHKDDQFSLILGDSVFNRFLSKIGIASQNNLFVPYRYISRFDTNLVQLNKNKDDLTKMVNDIIMDSDGYKLYEQQKMTSHDARMELYNESLIDAVRSRSNNTL